jgi:hypothetical protein
VIQPEHERQADPVPTYDKLLVENSRRRKQVETLASKAADLTAKLGAALAEVERLKRGARRQATPFMCPDKLVGRAGKSPAPVGTQPPGS